MRERSVLALLRVARGREREALEGVRLRLAEEADRRAAWQKAVEERERGERSFRARLGRGARGEELWSCHLWVERLAGEEERSRTALGEAEKRRAEAGEVYRERRKEVRVLEVLRRRIREREEERRRTTWPSPAGWGSGDGRRRNGFGYPAFRGSARQAGARPGRPEPGGGRLRGASGPAFRLFPRPRPVFGCFRPADGDGFGGSQDRAFAAGSRCGDAVGERSRGGAARFRSGTRAVPR